MSFVARCIPVALSALVLSLSRPPAVLAQGDAAVLTVQGAAADTVSVRAEPYRVRFTLSPRGVDPAAYDVSCSAVRAVTCVSVLADPRTLGPTDDRVIEVAYRATRPGRGLVVLRVRDPRTGTRGIATLLVTVLGS